MLFRPPTLAIFTCHLGLLCWPASAMLACYVDPPAHACCVGPSPRHKVERNGAEQSALQCSAEEPPIP
eukprot:93998-Chlamydomonas_euryale.AAC.1